MPGNINGIMWGDNISFSLTKPTAGDIVTDGQLIIGSTGNNPQANTLASADGSVTITNGPGTIDLAAITGAIFSWVEVTSSTQAIAVQTGYIINRGGGVTLTLPATATVGDVVRIGGFTGLWVLAQNAGQTVHVANTSTTTGVGGSITSIQEKNSIEIVCVATNTDWTTISLMGNLTIV